MEQGPAFKNQNFREKNITSSPSKLQYFTQELINVNELRIDLLLS